jgi:hypothetical protein
MLLAKGALAGNADFHGNLLFQFDCVLASRAQRSAKRCAAEPGPLQIHRLERFRISGASLR